MPSKRAPLRWIAVWVVSPMVVALSAPLAIALAKAGRPITAAVFATIFVAVVFILPMAVVGPTVGAQLLEWAKRRRASR